MVSYAELCQAIERWQRSQGRVTELESALQQAMWRGFIQHHAPQVNMQFSEQLDQEQHHESYEQPTSLEDPSLHFPEHEDEGEYPYAATGS